MAHKNFCKNNNKKITYFIFILETFRIVSTWGIGRLSYQKNQLFLIRSFALISSQNPNWILTIVGEGEYRERIQTLIIQEKLQDRVELIGAVKDIDFWYKNSSFLVFPSLWEGFPNVLAESFRQGLPAIGLQKTSENQLIEHNRNGLLVNDNELDFASAMQQMINNYIFRDCWKSLIKFQRLSAKENF